MVTIWVILGCVIGGNCLCTVWYCCNSGVISLNMVFLLLLVVCC